MSIPLLQLRNRLVRWPGGVWLFGKLVCRKAPYFASIAPRITALHAGHGEATMRRIEEIVSSGDGLEVGPRLRGIGCTTGHGAPW